MREERSGTPTPPPKGRLAAGGIVFGLGLLCPLFIPLVMATRWSIELKAAISGLLLVGIPELFMLVAIAVLGKPGYEYLKAKIFGLLKRQFYPKTVSRTRHRIGVALLSLPLLFGWAAPYVRAFPGVKNVDGLAYALVGDLLLLAALLVLGGDFWDKIRALFVYTARVEFQPPTGPGRPAEDRE